jgi:hypothetical protein
MWFQKHQKPEVLMHPNMIYELSRLSLSRDGTRIYEITFSLDFYHSQLLQLIFFCTTWRDQADLAPGLRVYVGSEKDATAFYAGSMTAFMLLLAQHGRNRSGGVKRQRDTK